MAQEAYRKNSVPAALLQSIRLKNINATDLTGDGVIELIGNFEVGDKYTPHTLFLIAAKQDDTYQAELTWYHHAVEEADYEARSFVDQLDLDGDGIDEVISAGHYYEGGDYQIYKKQKGQWQVIYQGGGGGC